MSDDQAIHWFRNDLRLSDNPSFNEAVKIGFVIPLYIIDTVNTNCIELGQASNLWRQKSLIKLNSDLKNQLSIFQGDPLKILYSIILKNNIKYVFWNRCYEPWQIKRDSIIKEKLIKKNIVVKSFNASLLWEPWQIKKKDNTPYKIFTPFFRKGCLSAVEPRLPLSKPKNINFAKFVNSLPVVNLKVIPKKAWEQKILKVWNIGETAAQKKATNFFLNKIQNYKNGRDYFSEYYTSLLSPHIHFGEISVNQLWFSAQLLDDNDCIDRFLTQLGWREFSYNLLYYNNDLPVKNLQDKFNSFDWGFDKKTFDLWKQGKTGIPMVDAGMRELWNTGYMHNRSRMITASFLVKNLLINWTYGEKWFRECLMDADLANNSASWQWVAGCGTDAAPYFRIFNPVTQGKKFDNNGDYIRKFIPEIKKLSNEYIHNPWQASKDALEKANVKLGVDYPMPIVDLVDSRNRALTAYNELKKSCK